jgi:hypothetical protein
MFDLSVDWYRTRLDEDWQPATAIQAEAIVQRHGLSGPFWKFG